jgi:hypothetical protein
VFLVDSWVIATFDEGKAQLIQYGPAANQISLHEEVSSLRFHAALEPIVFGSAQRAVACCCCLPLKNVMVVKILHHSQAVGVEEPVGLVAVHQDEE